MQHVTDIASDLISPIPQAIREAPCRGYDAVVMLRALETIEMLQNICPVDTRTYAEGAIREESKDLHEARSLLEM